MQIAEVPFEQLESVTKLIDRGATVFMAACSVMLVWLLLKEKDGRRKDRTGLQDKFQEKLDKVHEAETARAIKLELILQGLLELSEDFRAVARMKEDFKIIAEELRKRVVKPRGAPKSSPGEGPR